jgi:hypothetical protein
MSNPLNPILYSQLKRVFGEVKIAAEGVPARPTAYMKNPITGRYEATLDRNAEQYRTCCNFCGDTKFRLYINHLWGTRDAVGRLNLHALYCQNEQCYSDPSRRRDLYDRLTLGLKLLDAAVIRPAVKSDAPFVARPPGLITPLSQLSASHPAVAYLAFRFHDPQVLSDFYHVGYCSSSQQFLAQKRIYIPIYQQGKLEGWQCRYIGERAWSRENIPKYFSCSGMPRRKLVYNIDNACRYRVGVLMEGPMDVWSLGPMGMGTFGFPMTDQQEQEIVPRFKDHTLVVLFDPDVLEPRFHKDSRPNTSVRDNYHRRMASLKKGFGDRLVAVRLPHGRDPGSLARTWLRPYIAEQAKLQGVKIDWGLR